MTVIREVLGQARMALTLASAIEAAAIGLFLGGLWMAAVCILFHARVML